MDRQIIFPDSFGTRFSISVDTEEEFEWAGTLSRAAHGTTSVSALRNGQAFFQSAGVVPLYYVDKPVLDSDEAVDIFSQLVADRSADFGIHLHPWVTPPFDEDVNRNNSYAGNLPEPLERAKLRHMRDLMVERLGMRPITYRAGRYGIGPNSLRILADEGFRWDSSVRSLYDYRDDGGPDFRWAGIHPYWTGANGQILEVPLTTVFLGHARSMGRGIYGYLGDQRLVRGILSRLHLVQRISLTPEGVPAAKACEAIDTGLDQGLRLLTMSFHSPSLAIGHTPYVTSEADLTQFYRWFDVVFSHCAKRGIAPANVDQILAASGAQN